MEMGNHIPGTLARTTRRNTRLCRPEKCCCSTFVDELRKRALIIDRNRFVTTFGGAVLGTAVLAACIGSGALSGAAATAAPKRPTPGVHGEVHLIIWTINSDGPDFQAILSGAIGDYGPAVTVLPNGKVDPSPTSQMELKLRHGTFRLYIDGIAAKFRAQTAHEPLYPATCSDYFQVTATVPVVAGSGTGTYRGISGDFSSTLTDHEDEKTHRRGPFLARDSRTGPARVRCRPEAG